MGSFFEHIKAIAKTDVGVCRHENQDYFGIIEVDSLRAFLVADGMGGAKGGCLASSKTVEFIETRLQGGVDESFSDAHLAQIVKEANSAIFNIAASNPKLHGMGTTLVGLAFCQDRVLMVNVGDSRVYRLRDDSLYQLTCDHTVWNDLVRSGAISPSGDFANEISHMLTRSIGPDEEVDVDTTEVEVKPGDIYLLCSDGLYNMITERDIVRVLSTEEPAKAVEVLVSLANDGGGKDNITALVVRVDEDAKDLPECEESIEGLRLCDLEKDEPAFQSLRDEDSKKLGFPVADSSSSSASIQLEAKGEQTPQKRSSDIHLYLIGAVLGLAIHMLILNFSDEFEAYLAPDKGKTVVASQNAPVEKKASTDIAVNDATGNVIQELNNASESLGDSIVRRTAVWGIRARESVNSLTDVEDGITRATSLPGLKKFLEDVRDRYDREILSLSEGTKPKLENLLDSWQEWRRVERELGAIDSVDEILQLRPSFPEQFTDEFVRIEQKRNESADVQGAEAEVQGADTEVQGADTEAQGADADVPGANGVGQGTDADADTKDTDSELTHGLEQLRTKLFRFIDETLKIVENDTLDILQGREVLRFKRRQHEMVKRMLKMLREEDLKQVNLETIKQEFAKAVADTRESIKSSLKKSSRELTIDN